MRELKFRAWDLDNFNMFYTDGTNCDDGEWGKRWGLDETLGTIYFEEYCLRHEIQGGEDVERECWHRPKQLPMQYTGLKDKDGKDGKEIYEGDIMGYSREDNDRNWNSGGKECFPVIFENGEFRVDFGKYKTSLNSIVKNKEIVMKIIGNIYENPELLAKGDK